MQYFCFLKRSIFISSILFSLVSCGGGSGGGGSSVPFYGGVWKGTVSVSRDTCSVVGQGGIRATLNFSHDINQSDRDITIDSGSAVLSGMVDIENERIFSASRNSSEGGCTIDTNITYLVSKNDLNIADIVSVEITQICGSMTCVLGYVGTGRRN